MKFSNILRNAFCIVTALLVVFIVFLQCSGAKGFAVQSESMAPMLHRGDVVFVRGVDFADLAEGDVVSAHFPQSDGVFTHRIRVIDTQTRQIVTRGDANMADDPEPTQADKIIGKYWFSLPLVGYLSLYLQSRVVLYVLLGAIFVLVAIRTILQMRKKTDE